METERTKPTLHMHDEVHELPAGKDELNLAEFPIALLSEKAPPGVRTLEFKDQIFDGRKKKLVNRKLTIEGSETYGLPTAKDDEVILALIQLSKRARFDDRRLDFTRYELIQMLGWPNTGQSYSRVELALRRWVSVTLHYENAWWDKTEERWTSGAFHIIDDFEMNDSRETTRQMSLLTSHIIWSSRVFGSFVGGHLKNIKYDIYVTLRSAISKRMYRFLDKRFHHAKKCSFDLRDFAHEHVGLSRSYRDCGKLKEKLAVGIRELEEIGFIEPLPAADRYQHEGRGSWRVTFTKVQRHPPHAAALPQTGEPETSSLLAALLERGVTEKSAAELASRHPAESIQAKIEVFDWLVEKQDRRVAKSPEGYLVKSIEDDYKAPKGFVSRAERERRSAAAKAKEQEALEASRREREAKERAKKEEASADAYWDSLAAEQKRRIEEEALARGGESARKTLAMLRRMSGGGEGYLERLRREYLIEQLRQGSLPLSSA